jgi:hypothetical protein
MFQRNSDDRTMMRMIRWLSMAVLLTGCTQQDNAIAQNTKPAPIARGSLSPSAPVKLDYRIAHEVIANQQSSVSIEIATRLDHGSLLVEIAKQQGVSLLSTSQRRFDLASAPHPIKFDLSVLPTDQSERFLILLLTVDTDMGPMSRSFRIDFSAPVVDDSTPPSNHP